MREKFSNYETMKQAMAVSFLNYDQQKMIRQFCLKFDEAYLYFTLLERSYRIDRTCGTVQWTQDAFQSAQEADYNEAMTIYDVLCSAKEGCRPSGEFVNISSLSAIQGGTLARSGGIFQKAVDWFRGKTDLFSCACSALGGKAQSGGDAAFRLQLFPFLPIILRYWDADEDFPASMQVLVDKNILDYMHYETVMFALSHVFRRLEEEAVLAQTVSALRD